MSLLGLLAAVFDPGAFVAQSSPFFSSFFERTQKPGFS